MKTFYRRNLPHIQPIGACFFVTFRLFNSIPKASLDIIRDTYTQKIVEASFIKDQHKKNSEIFQLRKNIS